MEEKKNIIAEAGMELTDDELDMVTGGIDYRDNKKKIENEDYIVSMKRHRQFVLCLFFIR